MLLLCFFSLHVTSRSAALYWAEMGRKKLKQTWSRNENRPMQRAVDDEATATGELGMIISVRVREKNFTRGWHSYPTRIDMSIFFYPMGTR
jgi:hypothetical protein